MMWLWVSLIIAVPAYTIGVVIGVIACHDVYQLRRRYPSEAEKWAFGFLWPFVVLRGVVRWAHNVQKGSYGVFKVFGDVFRKVWSS